MLYALGAWYLVQELVLPHKKPTGICNQNERVAVVTGGGRGIGLEAVKQFLSLDMTVVIGGRNVSLMEKAIAELRSSGITGGRAECLELDLKSLDSVRKFANQFLKLNLPLHLLVNNAGIMFWPEETTEDGYESHWSVNYLGHFLLTHLLYPVLKTSSSPKNPSRVVNLTSSVHYIGSINFDDIASKKCYSAQAAYAQSKLAQMMFTVMLNKLEKTSGGNILVNAVHPGVVATELFQHVAWNRMFPFLGRTFLKNPKQGSDTVVHVSLSSQVTEGGHYYENCTVTRPARAATKDSDVSQLWDLSCHQTSIDRFGHV